MAAPRKFDWDEAKRLRAEGLTYTEIGRRLGVSHNAVRFACDARARISHDLYVSEWQRTGTCPDCGGQATRGGSLQHRCWACSTAAQATSVRPTELQCVTCREWKPDEDFPRNRAAAIARRGRHSSCRRCLTILRREYRQRNREKENAYSRAYKRKRRERARAAA